MELRLNLLFLVLVGVAGAALTTSEPYAACDPAANATRKLARLEDAFARAPADEAILLALTGAYFDQSRPELVLSSIGRADAGLRDVPEIAHRQARAFESLGRFVDARAAADRAFESCLRVEEEARCGADRLAIFEIHRAALGRIVAMGIEDPNDARIRSAYDGAMRRVTVVIGGG